MSSSGAKQVQRVTKVTKAMRRTVSPSPSSIYLTRRAPSLSQRKPTPSDRSTDALFQFAQFSPLSFCNGVQPSDFEYQLKRGRAGIISTQLQFQQNTHYHTTTLKGAGADANIKAGNGLGPSKSSPSSPSFPDHIPGQPINITPVQRRNADLELERMIMSTQHILCSLSSKNDGEKISGNSSNKGVESAFVNEIKLVLNYWVMKWSSHFHPYITPAPTNVLPIPKPLSQKSNDDDNNDALDESVYSDYGSNQAMRIIQSLLLPKNEQIMTDVLSSLQEPSSSSSSPSIVFASLVHGLLLPCMTNTTKTAHRRQKAETASEATAIIDDNERRQKNMQQQQHIQFSSNTGLHSINPLIWKQCIFHACQVIDIFDEIVVKFSVADRENCTNKIVEQDVHMYNARLLAWSKLVTLLTVLNARSGGMNKVGTFGNKNRVADSDTDRGDNTINNGLSNTIIDWGNVPVSHLYCDKNNDNDDFSSASIDTTAIGNKYTMQIPTLCHVQSIEEAITKMEETIRTMEGTYYETENESIKPNIDTYNTMIGALARSHLTDSPERSEWYLRRMEKTEDMELKIFVDDDSDEEHLPTATVYADEVSYSLVLHAYASAAGSKNSSANVGAGIALQNAEKAEKILERMEERYKRTQRENVQPSTVSYSTVLHGYANAGKAPEAERILNQMIELSNIHSSTRNDTHGSISPVQPNLICFNIVIDAWAKTKGHTSADNAHSILSQLENLASNHEHLYPNTISYSSVISAFARSGRDNAGDRAEELLQRSLELYRGGQDGLKPDSITFITVLDALGKQCIKTYQRRRNTAERDSMEKRINAIFDQMNELQASGDDQVRACTVSYNILLDLYAKTLQVDKAKKLLEYMTEQGRNGNNHAKPDIVSYNSVLYGLSHSKRRGDMQNAVKLLKSMEDGLFEPDKISYNTVMNGLAKCNEPRSNQQVHAIFLSMDERYKNGTSKVRPDQITYNICIGAWSKSGEDKAVDHVEKILESMIQSDGISPDVFSFTGVMSTIAKSGKDDAPEHCASLISKMKELGVKPNRYTYNTLINCWSRSGRQGAAEMAEGILIDMTEMNDPDLSPDSVTFSSVMNCWAKSGEKGSGQRAEKILDLMEDYSKSGNPNLKPTKFAYGAVLNAWAKSGDDNAVQKALDLLDRMEKMYLSGNDDARPSVPSYNAVINGFAKSDSPTKATDAEAILNSMIDSYEKGNTDAKPNDRTYGTLLNACAYTKVGTKKDKAAAFRIARRCFREIISHGQPSSMTFSLFILSCLKLVPPGTKRDQLVASVFDECCSRGLVDTKVIHEIRKFSPKLKNQILQGANLENGIVNTNDIPEHWRSNVGHIHRV